MTKLNRQPNILKAFGKIERFKHDLHRLESTLASAPLWLPGASLKKQCEQASKMIDGIAERFGRRLVVTLIGPSGAGKSTLLNAMAGVDDFSEVGHRRPTTGSLIVFCNESEDARMLAENLGGESVEVRSSKAAVLPEHVILIDSPDTDSRANARHIPILRNAIANSDMLICVFDAENPKRRDHVDFLAPFVEKFDGESLVGVINKCDRLEEKELKDHILPDFTQYIRSAWNNPVDRILCISARRHLHDPKWVESAGPKHDFEQFEELRKLVFDTINSAGYIVDRRLENAGRLREFVFRETAREIAKDRDALKSARQLLCDAEKIALLTAATAMIDDGSRRVVGVNLMVYQRLAEMWLGPMGWMIAIWARLLVFGTGIISMFRFGRPLQQLFGMISAFRSFKGAKSAAAEPYNSKQLDAALRNYRLEIMKSWPDIAARMVKGRFASSVRRIEDALDGSEDFGENIAAIWAQVLDRGIERVSRKLSGLVLQLSFNAPGIAILGYTGWLTVSGFLSGSYLAGSFFLHAFWVIVIVLLFSFFLLQMCIRLIANARRINARALEKLKNQIDQIQGLITNPVRSQLEIVLDLADHVVPDALNS